MLAILIVGTALAGAPLFEAPAGQSGIRLPGAANYPAGEWTIEGSGQTWQVPTVVRFGAAQGRVS